MNSDFVLCIRLIGLSANGLKEHEEWVKDINEYGAKFGHTDVKFPIVRQSDITYLKIELNPSYRLLTKVARSLPSTTCLTPSTLPIVTPKGSLSP